MDERLKAIGIAKDVLENQHMNAAWPVQHMAPLAREYLRLTNIGPVIDSNGVKHGSPASPAEA